MAYAQPVPGVTDIAPAGQLFAQAPHSIQRSLSQIMAFLFLILKILCGQTTSHIPQPTHLRASSFNVTTPSIYRNSI